MSVHASPDLSHIEAWIFDLDNTLYPASCDLFALIDERMTAYVGRLVGCDPVQARAIQKRYFRDHGTTLSGLMALHGTDPRHFLGDVHDIALDRVEHDARLVEAIARLPGRKLVFTNGDVDYAQRVLDRIGLGTSFEAIHDIHAMDYVPKPAPASYAAMCARWDIDPAAALFAEDMARNLKPAKALGMTTLWINNGSEQASDEEFAPYIDYRAAHLTDWLHELTGEMA
ncbi:pyrimidine 5'-nucleotidase [Sphingomonas sp. SUN039]|uniref:pyrimidine 5'-nucleotidase n=1 Tax=Sphingomonas sp. SUN039 TaxID=2937787 RepID=UPI00216432C6|nr:pyrimidine 5'-nucleotidase [Sphingomonas sp. SUN039]UVO54702.1 pyrimidine 5'-nucleotidase [Sphingomonas sp. SUN039]